jgi:glycine dehydrogenase subunit 1
MWKNAAKCSKQIYRLCLLFNMGTFIAHSKEDIESMLKDIGLANLEELYAEIPQNLRLERDLSIEPGRSEFETKNFIADLTEKNKNCGRDLVCFAGGGAYDHLISSVTKSLGSRSEFVTAYTPYQPEVAQGVLQAVFEYQSLMARLSGLEISNASLYDGAHSLVEAVNVAVSLSDTNKVLVSKGVNPNYVEVVKTFSIGTGHEIIDLELIDGLTDFGNRVDNAAAVVVQYPNYLGNIEELKALKQFCDRIGALLIVVFDPIACSILKSPGELGADIAVGEGQSLGIPLSFGGPYLGIFTIKKEYVRKLPGRIVGMTLDSNNKTAYVTTLRSREQDIRREKASSNVCTNQTLLAIVATIQLSWLGTYGLAEVANRCAVYTHETMKMLCKISGVKARFNREFFREFAVITKQKADTVLERLADMGYLGGIKIPENLVGDDQSILITVTEKRTKEEILGFVSAFEKAVA